MKNKFSIVCLIFVLLTSGTTVSFAQNNNVLIEVSKATWCQWCPCADNHLHQIVVTYPDAMIFNYHMWNSDPFQNYYGNEIRIMLGYTAIPTAIIGRRTGLLQCSSGPCTAWYIQIANQTALQPGVSIDIIKTYNPGTRELQIRANVTALRQIDSVCNINFVITESGIIYLQIGNSICPGSPTWVHDWVVRSMVNTAAGEQLNSSGSWELGVTMTRTWTTTLSANWVDANCIANVFVYKQGTPLNSGAHVLQTKKQSVTGLTGISNNNEIPNHYSLSQNYPNPFNPVTNIKFSIPKEGYASLKIYDMTGAIVQTYVDGNINAGTYNAEIDGSNLSSGVYYYQLTTADFTETKKLVLLK